MNIKLNKKGIVLIFSLFLITGCDVVVMGYEDVEKYIWLSPFLLEENNFKGSHDTDNASFNFSISVDDFHGLEVFDSIAIENGWKITNTNQFTERIYSKNIQLYPSDDRMDTLKLVYTLDNSQLKYFFNE